MPRKALNLNNGFNYTGVGTGNGIVEANAKKIDDTLAELDYDVVVVPVAPGTFSRTFLAVPAGKTLASINGRRNGSLNMGTYELTVLDGDANSLIASPPFGTTFGAVPLTSTTANLAIGAGEPIQITLTSSSGGAPAAQVSLRFGWAAA